MAPNLQADLHSPQRIHSLSLIFSVSILQTEIQALQLVHLLVSTLMPKIAVLLKKEYIAPRGQKNLQKGLNIKTDQRIKARAKAVFHEKRNPRPVRKVSLERTNGHPAKIVPSGQNHLQKNGEEYPSLT